MRTPARVLICYDRPDDDTLPAVRGIPRPMPASTVEFVRNPGRGAHAAVMAGFAASTAPFVVVLSGRRRLQRRILDTMVAQARERLRCRLRQPLHAGRQDGRLPVAQGDAGARRHFHAASRRAAADARRDQRLSPVFAARRSKDIAIESERGFCYSIELLVKGHRLGWRIGEVPARWFERTHGTSRFKVVNWLPAYLRWFCYAFATTYLRRPARSVAHERATERKLKS